jgi:hypothetical protein
MHAYAWWPYIFVGVPYVYLCSKFHPFWLITKAIMTIESLSQSDYMRVLSWKLLFFKLPYFPDDRPLLFFSDKLAEAYTPNAAYLLFYTV